MNALLRQMFMYFLMGTVFGAAITFAIHAFAQDTLAPVGKVQINQDDKVVYSRNVTITVRAADQHSGLKQMCLNEVPSGDCIGWIPYQETIGATLSTGNGIKTVCVRVMDNAGNVTSPQCDYIRLLE